MLAAVRAGAVGYVPGAVEGDRLRRIVAAAVNDEAIVPRTMVHELLLELRAGGAGADALTARESQVLGMLRRGQSTAAIAERLQITPVTVRRHISELVRKLGVADRSELVNSEARGHRRPREDGPRTFAGVGPTTYLSAVKALGSPLAPAPFGLRTTFARTRGRTTWQQQ